MNPLLSKRQADSWLLLLVEISGCQFFCRVRMFYFVLYSRKHVVLNESIAETSSIDVDWVDYLRNIFPLCGLSLLEITEFVCVLISGWRFCVDEHIKSCLFILRSYAYFWCLLIVLKLISSSSNCRGFILPNIFTWKMDLVICQCTNNVNFIWCKEPMVKKKTVVQNYFH